MNLNKLRGEIVAKCRTQEAFSVLMGWNKNKTSRMLCGSYKPNTDEVAEIVECLGMGEQTFCEIFLAK